MSCDPRNHRNFEEWEQCTLCNPEQESTMYFVVIGHAQDEESMTWRGEAADSKEAAEKARTLIMEDEDPESDFWVDAMVHSDTPISLVPLDEIEGPWRP